MNSKVIKGFSIVLCTYNGEARLRPTLKHLSVLKYPDNYTLELIIIDNASTDDTINTAIKIWEELGEPYLLRVKTETKQGKGHAIETGYDLASYPYIITVDDDNWLDENYILNAIEIITTYPNVGLIGGFGIPVFEKECPAWFYDVPSVAFAVGRQFETSGILNTNQQNYLWGAGLVVNTNYWQFIRSKGFKFITSKKKGKAVGEDSELCIIFQTQGFPFFYSDKLVFKHWIPTYRLTQKSCQKMFEGFGTTSFYFNLYNTINYNIKRGESVSKFRIYITLLRSNLKRLKHDNSKNQILSDLNKFRIKSELKELLKNTSSFVKIANTIETNLKLITH